MYTRTAFALVTVLFLAGRMESGPVDKTKLRQLARLPGVRISFGFGFSSTSGFGIGEIPDHWAEIARLQTQLKGDSSDAERYLLLSGHYSMVRRERESAEAGAKALAICRRQVREHPGGIGWRILLGESHLWAGDMEEGEKLLRRAVDEAPNEWRGWLALAMCVDSQSLQAVFTGKPFSAAFREDSLLIPAFREQEPKTEQIEEMRRLWKEARRYYDRAVALAPRDEAKAYLRRWYANVKHGSIELGLRSVRGEKVDPMSAPLTLESRADLKRIARLSSDHPEVVGPALICELIAASQDRDKLELKGDVSSCSDYLALRNRSLVDVLPAETRAFVRWCLARLERLTEHSDKTKAAAASEILAISLFAIHELGIQTGVSTSIPANNEKARKRALEYLHRAVRLDPSRGRAWDLLTEVLSDKKHMEQAIAIARRRLKFKDNAHNRFFLATVYADGNQFDKAAEELEVGLKKDPKDLYCRLGLLALAIRRADARSLKDLGEQIDALNPRIQEARNLQLWAEYVRTGGIHSALSDHPEWGRKAFQLVLHHVKGEKTATRALVALGEPLGPDDRQRAVDYIIAQNGNVFNAEKREAAPAECIYLNRDTIDDEDLFVLSAFPKLRELNLSSSAITDDGLARLKGFTALRFLDLGYTQITDKGLAHLKALPALRDLSLNDSRITDAGLSHLESLPNLESINLYRSPDSKIRETITDAGLAPLRKLPKLDTVTIGSTVTDKGLAHLAAIPRLRRLVLLSSKVTDEGLRHLERLGELEELWLSGADITDAGLARLKGLRNLQQLHLGGTKITDAGLVHLKELSRLEELELDGTAVSDAGLAHLAGLTRLRKLNLRDRDRTRATASASKKAPLTGTGLKHLQGLTDLKCLDLDGRGLTDGGLCDLKNLTHLEHLSLGTTGITDAGLDHLRPLKQLQLLNVRSTKVTRRGVAELRKTLPKLAVYR